MDETFETLKKAKRKPLVGISVAITSFTLTILLVGFYIFNIEVFSEVAMSFYRFPDPLCKLAGKDSIQLAKYLSETDKRIANLRRRIETHSPNEPYLIINTTNNTFILRTRKKVIREGVCSTGSYTLLHAGESQQWLFKTPKGQFRIHGKVADPVWRKPDWAFVEDGLPIPPPNHPDRFEYGTLGDYALSIGQGYLIHGTLYQRFLGLPVTHGCIRLGDEDLKVVYHSLDVGSRVYIF